MVLLPSNIDGSGCYRNLLPGRELRLQRGWDAHMAPHSVSESGRSRLLTYGDGQGGIDRWLENQDFDCLLWGQRGEPWTQALAGRLRAQGKRVLVDSDDAWWGLPDWNPGSKRPKGEIGNMRRQLQAADGLSVATPALAELYKPYNGNVKVIRNYLDWRMWEDVTPAYEIERRRVRIGWMGETRWRQGDMSVLRPWLGDWLRKHPEVEFVAAGDPRVHDLLDVPHGQRVTTGRVEFYNFDLADITATFDIGLVPLALDTPEARRLNECKSHLKGLEYAACGIPCIATPTESYRWWVSRGFSGFLAQVRPAYLASTEAQWVEALDALVENDWHRRRMGEFARDLAKENTLQKHIGEWEDWIAGSRPHPVPPRTRDTVAGSVGQR